MYALTRTPFGRMCNAVRENPERAQFVGYNPRTVRFIAFSLAGLFAGIAGGLAAINFELVNSSEVGAETVRSRAVHRPISAGSATSRTRPGRSAGDLAARDARHVTDVWQLYFGLLFVGMVMWAPDGMAGLIMVHAPTVAGPCLRWCCGSRSPTCVALGPGDSCLLAGVIGLVIEWRIISAQGDPRER